MENTEGIIISTDKSLLDIDVIYQFLSHSYWAKGRQPDVIRKSIENSLCFGVYLDKKQIGFARVVTDYATFAWIADVFIIEGHRGKGYSKQLLKTILDFPELLDLKRWLLATKDAHTLYSRFGFGELKSPGRFMEIVNNPASGNS